MPRNDKLYEESRIIRKAVNEGKTTSELMQMLSLTSAQIKYRVETRYTGKVASSIMKKLAENDKGVHDEEETQKSFHHNDTEFNNAIVVDTCALKYKGAFEFIMGYDTVILLVDVVKQMDNHKNDGGVFERNIRALLKESAEDCEERKIKIRTAGEEKDSTDSKLLAFCKGKNVVLYTADNVLATLARWFEIKYILAKNLEITEQTQYTEEFKKNSLNKKKNERQGIEQNEAGSSNKIAEERTAKISPDLKQMDLESLKRKMQENSITAQQKKVTIKNVSLLGKFLTLLIPETYKLHYQVISSNKVKNPVTSNMIHLKIGDDVVISTYKELEQVLSITRFEITDIVAENHAIYLGTDKVKSDTQIDKLDLPSEAKKEIKRYFSLFKKQ